MDEITRESWHVGKEIPIALIASVVIQTGGFVWWVSQLSSKLDYVVTTVSEFKIERYTREDARRDRELLDQRFQGLQLVDRDMERRIVGAESRLDRVDRLK